MPPSSPPRPRLSITAAERHRLSEVLRSPKESPRRATRAALLLAYADGETISAISRRLRLSRPSVQRSIDRALEMGVLASLDDRQRPGRPRRISDEARAWLVEVADHDPRELGYDAERWTRVLLARHAQEKGPEEGHPSLAKVTPGTVAAILHGRATRRPGARGR